MIQDLGVGEAITLFLVEDGAPNMVERTLIRPPSSRLGPATQEAIVQNRRSDPMAARYETPVDRNSAYEILMQRADQMAKEAQDAEVQAETASVQAREFNAARRYSGGRVRRSSSRVQCANCWGGFVECLDQRAARHNGPAHCTRGAGRFIWWAVA